MTEVSQTANEKTNKRYNYSRYGKICDQSFYYDPKPSDKSPEGYQSTSYRKSYEKPEHSVPFNNVSRQQNHNLSVTLKYPKGQFTHHPQFFVGRRTNPKWSFSKAQKYKNQSVTDYQICPKNHMLHDQSDLNLTKSVLQIYRNKVRLNKSSSFVSTNAQTSMMNYSILGLRDTSPVGFYGKTKIKDPSYLTKQGLMKIQQNIEKRLEHQKQPCPKGYIQFYKKKGRRNQANCKKFEEFLSTYNHQKQFSNYSETHYPISPNYHINFKHILKRKTFYNTDKNGPNPQIPKIDYTRVTQSNINVNLKTFRNQIKTRYDRVAPQPTTRLDYDIKQPDLNGMVPMQKVIGRHIDLFPIVEPIIKKPGDQQMKQTLKQCIVTSQN